MKIRAVTLGLDLASPEADVPSLDRAATFLNQAKSRFADAGVDVQTTRVAGPELGPTLARFKAGDFGRWTAATERAARGVGIDFLSFGRLPSAAHDVVEHEVAAVLADGEIGFLSADLIGAARPSIAMATACARAVKDLARRTDLGFGNLRFAATANCPPNIPFLPAAFHVGGRARFSIAVQAADVVVAALAAEGSMRQIEDGLVQALEAAVVPLERVAAELAGESGVPFVGIDLSPAPFPADADSIGQAIERAGVDRFGAPGTLYIAALVTRAIRRTRVQRCGFSGLMLPLLEDSVLARRASQHPPSIHELLLYSAVCGTGLDTLPLPEDVSEAELAGLFLDVASLSVALDGKPLTVRLLPVPGAVAGSPTTYTFDYFANSHVLPIAGAGAAGVLARG